MFSGNELNQVLSKPLDLYQLLRGTNRKANTNSFIAVTLVVNHLYTELIWPLATAQDWKLLSLLKYALDWFILQSSWLMIMIMI